jgi:putative endonuclease
VTGFRQRLGRMGEDYVAARLSERGWEIVARNWRTRRGEIDLVAIDGESLVLCEVRTRRAASIPPEESLTGKKQLQLARMGEAYVSATRWQGPWRVDVAAVELDARDVVTRFAYYEDAVGGW